MDSSTLIGGFRDLQDHERRMAQERYAELLASDTADAKTIAELKRLADYFGKSNDEVAADHAAIQEAMRQEETILTANREVSDDRIKELSRKKTALVKSREDFERAYEESARQMYTEDHRLQGLQHARRHARQRLEILRQEHPEALGNRPIIPVVDQEQFIQTPGVEVPKETDYSSLATVSRNAGVGAAA